MKSIQLLITPVLAITFISLLSCGEKENIQNSENPNSKEQPVVKSHEEVLQEQLTTFEELSDTIQDVTDVESAKVAIPLLTEIGFKFNRLKTDLQNAAPVTEQAKSELEKKYRIQRQETLTKVIQHMNELKSTQPDAERIISKLMGSILR